MERETISDMEIFRAGTHTSSDGRKKTFTEADLDKIAAGYDPAFHEAPVVIGHPADNHPAYGWVKGLRRVGEKLMATVEVVPQFAEALRQKLFKKRSASLYENLDGKGMYLRHVGFLGAMPPAVKALADINLSDSSESVTIEFVEEVRKMNFKEWFKGFKRTVAEMPEDIPEGPVKVHYSEEELKQREQEAADAAAKKAREEAAAEFAEKAKKADDERAAAAHKTTVRAKADALLKEGRIIPAWEKMGLVQFMEGLPAASSATVEFAEGKKQTPYDWFVSFLEGLPAIVNFQEIAKRDNDPGTGAGAAAQKLTQLVEAKMKADDKLSYSEAFNRVQVENPALALEYAESLRP